LRSRNYPIRPRRFLNILNKMETGNNHSFAYSLRFRQ
jgi:hypothetical protein